MFVGTSPRATYSEQFAAATGCKVNPDSALATGWRYTTLILFCAYHPTAFYRQRDGGNLQFEIKTVENENNESGGFASLNSWYIQVQYQMYVLGLTTTYIAVLCKGCHLRYFKVPYNAEIAEGMLSKGLEFFRKSISKRTPLQRCSPTIWGRRKQL